jgi:hypothetical protein
MSELDDATKAEISRAVSIVAQDKHWTMVRDIHGRTAPPDPPPNPKDPPKEGDPPPPPEKPENEDPPPKPDRWWGDRLHEK